LITRNQIDIKSNGAANEVNGKLNGVDQNLNELDQNLNRLNGQPNEFDQFSIGLNGKLIRFNAIVIKRGQEPSGSGDERSRRDETAVRFLCDVFEERAHVGQIVVSQPGGVGAAT